MDFACYIYRAFSPRWVGLPRTTVCVCTHLYYSFMWVYAFMHVHKPTLLGFSIGGSYYPPLWNGGGGGLTLLHSTGAANPVIELTSSILVWIEPSPIVDSINILGRLQLVRS